MLVLGLDPGVATVGFGLISAVKAERRAEQYGVISTSASLPLSRRLDIIFNDLTDIIERFKPDSIAIEELFFNTNLTTGINVAHARGVMLLAAHRCLIPTAEYTPLQVKQAVTGYGRADKRQMQQMVMRLLGLSSIPKPDDAADALAIALCHAQNAMSLLGTNKKI
jgi:crossover junction endodeoxyribonuclease RuvC